MINRNLKLFASTVIAFMFPMIALSGPPSAPTGVRIDIYTDDMLEVFWSRSLDDGGVIGYELIRNGQSIWVGDVLSYLDRGISPGLDFSYSVRAMDTDGNQSAASQPIRYGASDSDSASCTSNTGCSVSSSSSSVLGGPSSAPVESSSATSAAQVLPTGSYGSVYSSSAVEIFWDRTTGFTGSVEYEITRNGAYQMRTTGLSHYDDGLQPATDYRYDIRIVTDDNERLLTPAVVQLRTRDGSVSGSYSSISTGTSVSGVVSGDVYSSSAAEIFWQEQSGTRVDIFEIERNGYTVSRLDASSYYDDSLSASSLYQYEVFAIVGSDRVSLGSVELQTPALW